MITKTYEPVKRKPPVSNIDESNAKKPKNMDNKFRAPTLEEINELKETRNLFHSNLFRLQVKEMLTELKIKQKYTNFVQSWFEEFKQFVEQLQSEPNKVNVNEMMWLHETPVQLPLALKKLRVNEDKLKSIQFQFVKPCGEPMLMGAAAINCLLGTPHNITVDIGVIMPSSCFQKDSYLNLEYDQRRALYVTYIASELLKSQLMSVEAEQLMFGYHGNDPLKPVLEIKPPSSAGSIAKKLKFRIFVSAEEKTFKLSRFVPWNSNIRDSIFESSSQEDTEETVNFATPHYNSHVLFDLTMAQNQTLLNELFVADNRKNFQDGLLLLKVWLQQRQLNLGFSGMSGHILAMFMVYLWQQRKLHANMSSYQVARTVWNQLAHSTWEEPGKGISICSAQNVLANQPTLEQMHAHYDVVFIDGSGFYNICSNLSVQVYAKVRQESKLAVDMLNDMNINSFHLIFMTKFPLYSQFDHILKINKADIIEQILEMHVTPADKHNFVGYAYPQLLKVVTSLLRKGLSSRIKAILPLEEECSAWSAISAPHSCPEHLHLGLILNGEQAYEVLDKGPESIAPGADEFRKFWGEKAQLRRFQDGSITESVVWAAATDDLSKKRLIVGSIVKHLLQHHFQLDASDFDYIAGEFDVVYKLTHAFKTDLLHKNHKVPQNIDSEAASLQVIRSFDDLARKLTALDDLPLEIVSIAGISPVFRYCEATPVLPLARCIKEDFLACHVPKGIIQLGSSGKWPEELPALRALIVAFYIKIAKILKEKHRLQCKVSYDGLYILKQGYVFALEISHSKQVMLLKKEKTEKGITKFVDCEESRELEKRHYVLPKITGALHSLYQEHPSFGGAVMIAKRWLNCQLIDAGLWPEECTELLMAALYMKTATENISCSPQTAFWRFLQLLANTDWKSEIFLLDFNNTMEESQKSALEQRFSTERDAFPPLCIATAYDLSHQGVLWTTPNLPNINVLARVTILAREALSIIEPALNSKTEAFVRPSKLFMPSNQGYDLIIQLKPDMIQNTLGFDFGSGFTAISRPNWRLPQADSNFLQLAVAQLREAYSEYAAFFYNAYGGKEIAVVWKPQVFEEKEFKVNEVNGCSFIESSSPKVQCKQQILIEDFKFILKDFFVRIDTPDIVFSASRQNQQRYFEQSNSIAKTKLKPTKHKQLEKQSLKKDKPKNKLVRLAPKVDKPVQKNKNKSKIAAMNGKPKILSSKKGSAKLKNKKKAKIVK